jgi:hypothetical protein
MPPNIDTAPGGFFTTGADDTSDWSIVGFGGDDTSDWSTVGFGGDDTSDWSTVGFGSIFEGIGFSLGANRSSSLSSPNKESKKYIA